MRLRLVSIAIALLVSAALVGATIPAGAGTTDAEQAFCDKYQETSTSQSAGDPGDSGQGDSYRELAKVAPKKSIKKALKNIAKYFDELEDIDPDDQDAITDFFSSKDYTKYVKSTGKFTNYVTSTCSFTIE